MSAPFNWIATVAMCRCLAVLCVHAKTPSSLSHPTIPHHSKGVYVWGCVYARSLMTKPVSGRWKHGHSYGNNGAKEKTINLSTSSETAQRSGQNLQSWELQIGHRPTRISNTRDAGFLSTKVDTGGDVSFFCQVGGSHTQQHLFFMGSRLKLNYKLLSLCLCGLLWRAKKRSFRFMVCICLLHITVYFITKDLNFANCSGNLTGLDNHSRFPIRVGHSAF